MEKEDSLSGILRAARPEYSLPAGFPGAVWRRIRQTPSSPVTSSPSWLERLAEWWLRPRLALLLAALMVGLGIVAGVIEGATAARLQARERYLTSVAPTEVR